MEARRSTHPWKLSLQDSVGNRKITSSRPVVVVSRASTTSAAQARPTSYSTFAPSSVDVIQKEAWPFYRTISGVRLYWVLEEPKGPKGEVSGFFRNLPTTITTQFGRTRGTSLIRKRLLLGPFSRAMPTNLWWSQGEGQFRTSEVPLQGPWARGGSAISLESACDAILGWKGSHRIVKSRNVQRFRGGLVFKAHRLCVPLNSRLKSNKEEEEGKSWILSSRTLMAGGCLHEGLFAHQANLRDSIR